MAWYIASIPLWLLALIFFGSGVAVFFDALKRIKEGKKDPSDFWWVVIALFLSALFALWAAQAMSQ